MELKAPVCFPVVKSDDDPPLYIIVISLHSSEGDVNLSHPGMPNPIPVWGSQSPVTRTRPPVPLANTILVVGIAFAFVALLAKGRVSGPATGTRSSRIAYWQSVINNSLAPKSTPKPSPNPTLTLP